MSLNLGGFLPLPHLLLMVAAVELAVYRLAVPALAPAEGVAAPAWHTALAYVGLFLFYFASFLAAVILLRRLILLARGEAPYGRLLGYPVVVAGAVLTTYAVRAMVAAPGETDTFLLELAFAAVIVLVVLAQLRRGGDLAAKVGLLLIAAPLLVHFYRDAGVRWLFDQQALWEGMPDRVEAYGQWTMVLAALLSPYCFAPRPFADAAGKLAPLAIGTFVGLVGALVMRQSYEVGYLLAKRGLGVDLGVGAPTSQIALYLIALGSITWTLTSCLMAPAPARRSIGVGLGLVVISGYAFAWPLQYLAGVIGFMTIAAGLRDAPEQERAARTRAAARFRAPAIGAEAWQAYIGQLVAALRGRGYHASTVSVADRAPEEPDADGEEGGGAAAEPPTAVLRSGGGASDEIAPARVPAAASTIVSLGGAGGVSRTHVLVLEAAPAPLRVLIERVDGAICAIEVVCGADGRQAAGEGGEGAGAPAWTLQARPDRRLGAIGLHPPPPAIRARPVRTGDDPFDRRFRVRDAGGHTDELLDDGLRARAAAVLDGWMAYWPGQGLVYHLAPGQGAPLDSPVPITQLAFGGGGAVSVDRMVTLVELVADIGRRALPGTPPSAG